MSSNTVFRGEKKLREALERLELEPSGVMIDSRSNIKV